LTEERQILAEPAKFLFETEFDIGEGGVMRADAERFTQDDLDAARGEGHRAGAAEAELREREASERRQAEALEGIKAHLATMAEAQTRILDETIRDATKLALAIAGKVAPELVRRQPMVEIEALIREHLQRLIDEPRIVVRVAESLLDPLKARIDQLAQGCGFGGKVVLIAEPTLASGDCRLEWADGGVERDTEAVAREIIDRVMGVIDGDHDTATAPDPGDRNPG